MKKLTENDWKILWSFNEHIVDREQVFKKLQLRANFTEMKELLEDTKNNKDPESSFNVLLNRFPHSMSFNEQEEIYREFLLVNWHHEHDDMVKAFQRYFNKNPKNIEVLLNRMYDLPEFYRHDNDLKEPFIRKCIYAIAAQPEPYNTKALIQLSKSNDQVICAYAEYQLDKIANNNRDR